MNSKRKRHGKTVLGVLIFLVVMSSTSGSSEDTDQCAIYKRDLIIIMDGTISLGYRNFDNQRDFVLSILSKMKFGRQATQLGIIQFSDQYSTRVEMELGFHGNTEAVLRNVSNIKYHVGRRTLTGLAMHHAYEQFFGGRTKSRPGVDKVVLLITDGAPADEDLLHRIVEDLKEKKVRIVSVAIGTRNSYIQRFRYIIRSVASGFQEGFKAEHMKLQSIVGDVAQQVCKIIRPPGEPHQTKGKTKLKQKCFQEKKDILFALDGSKEVHTSVFNKALSFVSQICGELDITPSLIHVGMLQYSDKLNTRVEFGLQQYTKYYQINESLENVFHSKGRTSDLVYALDIIDAKIFNGKDGDRISAEDYLLLFVNDGTKQNDQILSLVQKLKEKGVHVIIIGLGKPHVGVADFYEKLASYPSDVNYLESVQLKHIIGDLTAITCRKVNCEDEEFKKRDQEKRASQKEDTECRQHAQDVLFMIDTTKGMNGKFRSALKFFTKIVGKLNIAASNTHVGMMTFGKDKRHINFEMGRYKFENDITRKILQIKQNDKRSSRANLAEALRMVNKEIFNVSWGGHRKEANDLILIATRGKAVDRYKIKVEVDDLKAKGVRIAILNVGYKKPVTSYYNTLHDIASGAREIYPMDFRRTSAIAQALLDVQCRVEEKKVSPQCFQRSRQILFMLDSSRGLSNSQVPTVLAFVEDIVTKLYGGNSNGKNAEIGFMHYSDMRTATYTLSVKKRTLGETLRGVRSLRYRQGRKNYLGHALKYARKRLLERHRRGSKDQIIILLAHNEPADPEKAFKISERLRSQGVEIVTVVIHTEKTPMKLNSQYRALATSRSSAHSFDFNNLLKSSIDVLLNLCELNSCPTDSTKNCFPKKQDIFMVIDSSRSIGFNTYPHLRRFVRRFVNKLDVSSERTHLGILQASSYSRTQYEMKLGEFQNAKQIESVINEMTYHYGRSSFIGKGLDKAIADNLFNASFSVITNGYRSVHNDRPDAENVLMLYSDGVFHDQEVAKKKIEMLKNLGVRVVIVGLGRASRKPEAKILFEHIASSRSDVYLVNLNKASLLVEEELNEVAQHVTTLECQNVYPAPIKCEPESLDLFVVIDGSRSVGYVNFGKVQKFLKKLADEFLIGKDKAHFGVLQYGAKAKSRIEFNLGEHNSNKEVAKAIEDMQFLNSKRTDTGHALSVVNSQIFNGTGVDRPNVQNILILFTDGVAHDIKLAYSQAEKLRNKRTRIIVIGAGKDKEKVFNQIKRMASRKEDAHKSDFDELAGIVDDLLDVVCHDQ